MTPTDTIARLRAALEAYEQAMTSYIDGRDLLEALCPSGWHHCDIVVRICGKDVPHQGDWLKGVWYAREEARAALAALSRKGDGE